MGRKVGNHPVPEGDEKSTSQKIGGSQTNRNFRVRLPPQHTGGGGKKKKIKNLGGGFGGEERMDLYVLHTVMGKKNPV